jgi:hypothetical protein
MGEILRLQRHWQIAEIAVACRETSIHYDVNGLQVEEFLLIYMQYTRQAPLLYYDVSQKSPLFVSGTVVGESPPWAGR